MSKARNSVRAVLDNFYKVHHCKDTFEDELITEVVRARISTFSETKHAIIEALDYKIDRYQHYACPFTNDTRETVLAELECIRNFVKGMVVETNED